MLSVRADVPARRRANGRLAVPDPAAGRCGRHVGSIKAIHLRPATCRAANIPASCLSRTDGICPTIGKAAGKRANFADRGVRSVKDPIAWRGFAATHVEGRSELGLDDIVAAVDRPTETAVTALA